MSDFITTMTARAMGEIPTVEPLMYSMYFKLPAMPSDYTEDTLSESEPSEFIDNEPNLSFKPLVTPKGFSATMPRWDINPNIKFDSVASLAVDSQYDVTSDSGINIETENTFNTNSKEEKDNIFQPVTEISEYPIAPQINRSESTSQSVEAPVEFDSNISTNESQLQLDDIEFPIDKQSNNTEDKETISKEIPKGDNNQPAVNSNNLNSEAGVLPNILPQVKHWETASQSVEAPVEFDLSSTSESQLEQNFNHIEKPLNKQLTNTQNSLTQKAPEIDKLETSSVKNPSSDETRNQQTQIDRVNQKKIQEKTVIPNLINDSQLTNQKTANLKETTLTPLVNRVKTAKSVKPDIQLDAAQLNLQNPLQQQRSINKAKKITKQEILKTQTGESSLSQFNNNSQSQTPISSQQQSIQPNLHLRSNLVNQSNTEFVEKSEITSSISSVKSNLTKEQSVIPPEEDTIKLLPSPIVNTSSPIHSQTEFRQHQAEFQPSTTIEVTIGRIEVRQIQPERSPTAKTRKSIQKSPALSLSDYLKQRDGK